MVEKDAPTDNHKNPTQQDHDDDGGGGDDDVPLTAWTDGRILTPTT